MSQPRISLDLSPLIERHQKGLRLLERLQTLETRRTKLHADLANLDSEWATITGELANLGIRVEGLKAGAGGGKNKSRPRSRRSKEGSPSSDLPADSKRGAVLELLAQHPEGLRAAQIAEHFGWSVPYANGTLSGLRQNRPGLLVRLGRGLYTATPGAAPASTSVAEPEAEGQGEAPEAPAPATAVRAEPEPEQQQQAEPKPKPEPEPAAQEAPPAPVVPASSPGRISGLRKSCDTEVVVDTVKAHGPLTDEALADLLCAYTGGAVRAAVYKAVLEGQVVREPAGTIATPIEEEDVKEATARERILSALRTWGQMTVPEMAEETDVSEEEAKTLAVELRLVSRVEGGELRYSLPPRMRKGA